jgi:hypothetical protein
MTQKSPNRRDFLRGILWGAVSLPLLRSADLFAADALPRLAPSDPAATALGYIENASKIDAAKESSYKTGSKCANCVLYQSAAEQKGYAPCSAFPGKSVNASGWCRAWAAKS